MSEAQPPLVTVGIPLYRARRFVPRIVDNIESITYPEVEFILADHHQLDDAVELLRKRLGHRPRVRLVSTRDELRWFENYGFLFRQASGKYFRLLSQDDRILPDSIGVAVEALEAAPRAVLAYGPVEVIDGEGRRLAPDSWCGDRAPGLPARWSRLHALGVYADRRFHGATFGLIRKSACPEGEAELPETHAHSGLSFRAWVFGLTLHGPPLLVPDYVSQRCVHPESFTSKHLERGAMGRLRILASYFRAAHGIWRRAAAGFFERRVAAPVLLAVATLTIPFLRLARLAERRALRRIRVGQARQPEPPSPSA